MIVYAALLATSAAGCAWLVRTHPHGLRELMAATVAFAPILTMVVLILMRGS